MAYRSNNLSVLSYTNGFTQWHYKTEDNVYAIQAPGYFSKAADMLNVNDLIFANCCCDANHILWVTQESITPITD